MDKATSVPGDIPTKEVNIYGEAYDFEGEMVAGSLVVDAETDDRKEYDFTLRGTDQGYVVYDPELAGAIPREEQEWLERWANENL